MAVGSTASGQRTNDNRCSRNSCCTRGRLIRDRDMTGRARDWDQDLDIPRDREQDITAGDTRQEQKPRRDLIGKEGDNGLRLLGCKGHCVRWLPSERPNYQWEIPCQLAEAAAKGKQIKTAWKTNEGSPISPGQCSCTQVYVCNGCCAWLTVALTGWSPSTFSWFGAILVPNMKNIWLRRSIGPMMRSYLQLRIFSRIRIRGFIPREFKPCNTDGRRVWSTGRLCWKFHILYKK